jgi:ABC-2 type transporter
MMRRQVAHLGVTVAAVIHQPGAALFAGLDDLLLLGRGGRSVYYGLQAGVQPYFESIGFRLPERVCSPLCTVSRCFNIMNNQIAVKQASAEPAC